MANDTDEAADTATSDLFKEGMRSRQVAVVPRSGICATLSTVVSIIAISYLDQLQISPIDLCSDLKCENHNFRDRLLLIKSWHRIMTCINSHRIEIAEDPVNPLYFRWQIFQDGKLLDLSGFAYATARSAKEAAQVALKWHLILEPLRSRLDMSGFHPQHWL